MAVLDEVKRELEGVSLPGWKRETAFALAAAMDESPNASTAKELRALMSEVAVKPAATGDVSDDLAAKRAARRSASG